jgi:thioredoxin 1
MNIVKRVILFQLLIIIIMLTACGQSPERAGKSKESNEISTPDLSGEIKYKVTFIELGSVRCIPCQQMQPVMKSVETKYGKEVRVIFYDVWTEAGKPFGVKYGIEAIPTQVFLDEAGKEYYRHVGFFAEEDLVKILQMKGVKTN